MSKNNNGMINLNLFINSFLSSLSSIKFLKVDTWFFIISEIIFINIFINKKIHLLFWSKLFKSEKSVKMLLFLISHNLLVHKILIFLMINALILFFMSISKYLLLKKYQNNLNLIKLENGENQRPLVCKIKKIDSYKTKLSLVSAGIGINHYTSKKNDLEAAFGEKIENIISGSNPRNISITFTKNVIARLVNFDEFDINKLKTNHFLLGKSINGFEMQNINELPHLLIAGTTGQGKSVFMKQVLLTLMISSPHLQIFILDMKKGVESKDFQDFPNVTVAKDISEALLVLNKVKKEMNKRFTYLEEHGHKEIDSKRDKMDKLIISIDEASLLYMKKNGGDNEEIQLVNKARKITDELAKLSRAANINLIMATQKVTKDTIDTHIQENISGKFCLKTNTLQGSLTVLGNKMSYVLPDIPGRGIWSLGSNFTEIQATYVTSDDINKYKEIIKNNFKKGERKMLQTKLAIEKPEEVNIEIQNGDLC
ncbi:MAG: hypothetical protein HQK51_05600 [Oligoflexia bacterium]|nr:hypothetical protein [Oligoflexia bacterium]